MTDDRPISEAYFLAVDAIGKSIGVKPLPQGLNTARIGDWTLTVNVSGETLDHEGTPVPPYNVIGANEVYLAFVFMGPFEGMVGGMPESRFVADMKAALA